MVLVPGGHPELSELCNYMMQHHQTAKWKTIGTLLGLPHGRLDIIDSDCKGKAEDCSTTMLAQWLSIDTTASWEKFKMVIDKTSQSTFGSEVDFSTISSVKTYLQKCYGARYTRPLKVCLPYKPEHFTNVAFIQHKHSEVTEESVTAVANVTYNGDIIIDDQSDDGVPQSLQCNDYYKSCKKCTDIFKFVHTIQFIPDREPFLLLIEGAPGMGKTIICKEIALYLSNNQNKELIFLVNLHEISAKNISSFGEFFECVCPGKLQKESKTVSDYLIGNKGKNVVVIIDGYEQLFYKPNSNVSPYVMRIINRTVLQFQLCDLIVSTRHAALIDLNQYKNWYRIELLGFTKDLQQEYIERSLGQSNSYNDVTRLKSYIQSNSVLKSLCYHPLFINYLVSLHQELKEIPHFQTELLGKFTCIMILWILRNQQEHSFINIISLFEKLPKQYQTSLNEISKLAFSALQGRKVVFELHKKFDTGVCELVIPIGKSFQISLGFVKVFTLFRTSGSKEMATFCFPLIQEFLAAFFVIQSENNVMNLWAKTQWTGKYINVWAYYFGLAKAVRKEFKDLLFATRLGLLRTNKLSSKILQDKMKCLYLVYCLMELPDEVIYQQAKQVVLKGEDILDISYCILTNESLTIIALFLLHYTIQKRKLLNLSNCCIDDDKLDYFIQQFHHMVNCVPIINIFDVSNNQLTVMSINGILRIANYMVASKIVTSFKKIVDYDILNGILSFTERPQEGCRLEVIENDKTVFLFCKTDLSHFHFLNVLLTNLYIIRCSLYSEVIDNLIDACRTFDNLSLLCFYDNKLLHDDILKLLDVLMVLKQLESFMLFEKLLSDVNMDEISSTVSMNSTVFQVLLVNTNKLLAQGANDHHILMALEYNPSIVHLQLNDCHVTDEVVSKIAMILNDSSQQWSLLDLSGSKLSDDTLRKFCNALDSNSAVNSINLASNKLTSLSLISKLILCLNPKVFDISGNIFANDDTSITSAPISMMVAQKLFAQDKQLSLTMIWDNDIVLFCHKLNHAITAEAGPGVNNNFTQVFVSDCTITVEMLLRLLHSSDSLIFLHLVHVKWSGEPLYNSPEFFKIDIFLSICENSIPKQIVNNVVKSFDADVSISRIISADDIFIAHKCSYELLNGYLTWQLLPLPTTKSLFYIQNYSLDTKHQNSDVVTDYLCTQRLVTEIVLCNNGLSQNNIHSIINEFQQRKLPIFKCIFICELQQQLHGTMTARQLLKKLNCSFIIIEEKAVVGRKVTSVQFERCLSLVSPLTTLNVLRFINCRFGNEHYDTLAGILSHHKELKEFSLYECNTNYLSTKKLVEALQMKSTLTSLLLSCNKVTPVEADSIATSLSTVISNNCALEKVSFKFDRLHSSACDKVFQSLSNTEHLKSFRFCDGEVTTKETLDQLTKVIANNPSLEIVNLKNNKLQSQSVKVLAEGFKTLHHLKILVLSSNQIGKEAADDIAAIIDHNVEIEKLLLYNNALTSEGVSKICKALKHHENLQVFRISHNFIQQEAANDIAEVINHNPKLKVLDIGDNRLLSEGVTKITRQLEKIITLQSLSLNENNITCSEKVAASIAKIITNNINLKVLHLHNNNFNNSNTSRITEALNKLTSLRELTVNNTGCTADHITTMISNNLQLEILDIGDNQLKSVGIISISKVLINLSYLKTLELYGNEITDDAASDIADVIFKLPLLEKLQLNNNAFEVTGIKTICKSLQHKKTLKLLQLDSVGITEKVSSDLVSVIDSNPLLECLYLGNNRLQTTGAITIVTSLIKKQHFKALSLNNNCISEDIVDHIVQFITSNPALEELLLNNNSIGTTGVVSICKSIQDSKNLKILNLADNNVTDEVTDIFASVIKSNTALEEISLDGNILKFDNNKLLITTLSRLSNLKCLHIDCKNVADHNVYKQVDNIFAQSNIEKITIYYLTEEMHFFSPLNTIETVIIIKANANGLSSHMPVLHSVVCKDRIEIVCAKDDALVDSEVMKMINPKTFQRLMLVFTKMNCFTDQEMNVLATGIANYNNINSLIINKLNANQYNKDISGVVIIEENKIIVILTADNLAINGIMKLINKIEIIMELMLCTGRMSNFTNQNIDEIVDIISKTDKLEKFVLVRNAIAVKAMETICCLTKTITFKIINVLSNFNIRNFDFMQKSDKLVSQSTKEIDKHQWHKIFCALKCNVDLKTLDLSGNAINEEVAQNLSTLLDDTTKLEMLSLEDCSIGINLKSIHLQKITTLKYLDLSKNNITEHKAIIAIMESNTNLEKLYINKNCMQSTAGDVLSVAIANLKNLKVLSIDQNIISRYVELILTTAFSGTNDGELFIYDHQNVEAIAITGSLCNTTTLALCKWSAKMKEMFFLTSILKTGVMLSLWEQDNALNKAGIIQLLSSFKKITTIKFLDACSGNLTEQEEVTIATLIRENTQLENILLGVSSQSYTGKSVAGDLHTFQSECKFIISNNNETITSIYSSHKFLLEIISAIKCHANIKTLDLSDNVFTEELAEQLATVLANCTKLETLLLRNCSLGNKGVNVIANSLKNIATLKCLDLSNNNITEELAIVNILKSNSKLNKFSIHHNCLQFSAGYKMSVDVNLKNIEVLGIDQNIINRHMELRLANDFTTAPKLKRTLFIYNHDHQTSEWIQIRGFLNNINALTLCKISIKVEDQPMITFILDNGSVMLNWTHSHILNTSGVLRFVSSLKKITTIKLVNNSDSELTELEVDTIATVISENVQLENVWLGSQSLKTINDDFVVLAQGNVMGNEKVSKDKTHNKFMHFTSNSKSHQSAIKRNISLKHMLHIFPNKLLLKINFALHHNSNLITLDLSGNVITEELAEQLAIVLTNFTKLETLLLRNCCLDNKVVSMIANSLKKITTLKHLDLSNNNITEELAIFNILKSNSKLKRFYLHQNCLQFSAGYKMSADVVNLKNIEVLSIDQNIISRHMALRLANIFTIVPKLKRTLFIYNHDHQSIERIEIRDSFNNINALTLCKISMMGEGQVMKTCILDNGSVMLWWKQSHLLNTSGVLRFVSSLKKITIIKLVNNSDSELTELEVDTIATVISENVQLENVWLDSPSLKTIKDKFVVLAQGNVIGNEEVSKDENLTISPAKKMFPKKLFLKILFALQSTAGLQTLDLSGNLITEELAEQLATVLANCTKLETLLLRNCCLDNEVVNVVANSIRNITTLKYLHLSWDNITEITANNMLSVLECNTGLEELCLDGSVQTFDHLSSAIKNLNLKLLVIDQNLIANDVTYKLINSIINNTTLQCLLLKNYSLNVTGKMVFNTPSRNISSLIVAKLKINDIGDQDPSSVIAFISTNKILVRWSQDDILASTAILRVVSTFKGVKSLGILNKTISDYSDKDCDEIMTAIASFVELEELIIHGCFAAFQNCVFRSLKNLISLKFFHLSRCRIHTSAMAKLVTLLFNNSKIHELDLNHCLLKSSQVAEITKAIKTHKGIKVLHLHCNGITNDVNIVDNLTEILFKNIRMQKLHINNNRLQAGGLMKILEVLTHSGNLTELLMGSNSISDNLSDYTVQRFYEYLVEVITKNFKLEALGIDSVCIHTDAASKVVTALKSLSCLKLLDMPRNNINEKAAGGIATVITKNPSLVKLYIADNYLQTAGISKIAKALSSPRGLEVLDITNNNISIEAGESLRKIIKNNPQLTSLLLGEETMGSIIGSRHNNLTLTDDNSWRSDYMIKLSDLLIQKQIQETKRRTKLYGPKNFLIFFLMNSSKYCRKLLSEKLALNSNNLHSHNENKLQSEGIKRVAKGLAAIKSLEILSIENNDVDDEATNDIATALVSNSGIKQLWVGQNCFTPSGISTILQSLLVGITPEDDPKPTLEVLDLSHSNLSLKVADDISAVLSKNYKIHQLWLEGNTLSSQSITPIAGALKKCTNILVLTLKDNHIKEAAGVLSEALSEKSDLQQLYLGNNQLEDRGVIRISEALNTTHGLLTLDLMNNNISEAAADALASVITSCSQLEQLYLGDNKLHSTGTIRIATAIQQANCRSTLRVLDLSNNGIGSDETVADEISRAVANTEILTVLILDDNALSIDGLLKITRSVAQSESAEWMMIFSVKRNGVVIGEEAEHEMRVVMDNQWLADCNVFITTLQQQQQQQQQQL